MQDRIHILCTGKLSQSLIAEVEASGIMLEMLPFIITEPVQSIAVQQEIELALLQTATVVFTSMNAVEAVVFYLDGTEPAWDIYCIGAATKKLVGICFGEEKIKGVAGDATALAELIASDRFTEEVIFFCGDHRRGELPEILHGHNIEVNEIIVYQTINVPHKITKTYHAILFFSPSAVAAFFKNNKLPASTLLFAIGNTTAKEIIKFAANKIMISDEPVKEDLIKEMIEYFT